MSEKTLEEGPQKDLSPGQDRETVSTDLKQSFYITIIIFDIAICHLPYYNGNIKSLSFRRTIN